MSTQVAQYPMRDPYVGISGVTTPLQAAALLEMAQRQPLPRAYQIGIFALTSYKALMLGSPSNRARYVQPQELGEVFLKSRHAINLVHYNSEAIGLYQQVRDLVAVPTYCDGVQLNIVWPRPDQLKRLLEQAYTFVVLQVGPRAYHEIGHSPDRLVERLRDYVHYEELGGMAMPLVHRVLLDASGGEGKGLDVDRVGAQLEAGLSAGLPFTWAVAGGLHAENVHQLQPLFEICPDLSFDAESGLRTNDELDLPKCRAFWSASHDVLSSARG